MSGEFAKQSKLLPEMMKGLADVSDDDCPTDWGGAHIVAENEPEAPA